MTLLLRPDSHTGILRMEGTFTFEAHAEFKAATTALLEASAPRELVLDLSGVGYMDSAALGMLLLLRERTEARGKRVVLSRPTPHVQSILQVVHFGRLFEIREA